MKDLGPVGRRPLSLTQSDTSSRGPGRLQGFVQMNSFCNYLEGLFGHPFLQVQPPKTGEVTSLEWSSSAWRRHSSRLQPAA